ncbi:TetR/AcrR family transcriptional regulator [Phaeacidiphilus oryzae]|uniref:TetR/AcrR family transcriptional regulator n=1 Tax=Phaeacidiphilus oryzae TaxID=348818 RepID=UPI0007C7A8B4|nr:TetR/AcrR family transcriptional regulator [Phaeacidiphilus oryzae]
MEPTDTAATTAPPARPARRETRQPAGAAVLRDDITEALRDAVFEELAASGYGRLSIEGVARRAGVGKTAVYRRWKSKPVMVIDVVSEFVSLGAILPDTGSLVGDLRLFAGMVTRALRTPLASQIIPDLLAEAARSPEIGQLLERTLRGAQLESTAAMIAKAVDRGELARQIDPDLALDLIAGPLYWHLAVVRAPLPRGFLDRLTASTVAALRAAAIAAPAAGPAASGSRGTSG